jgi:hypothetical protein
MGQAISGYSGILENPRGDLAAPPAIGEPTRKPPNPCLAHNHTAKSSGFDSKTYDA